jgi:hypothetical protein
MCAFFYEKQRAKTRQNYQLFDGGHASFPFTKNACQPLFAIDAIGIHHFLGFFPAGRKSFARFFSSVMRDNKSFDPPGGWQRWVLVNRRAGGGLFHHVVVLQKLAGRDSNVL